MLGIITNYVSEYHPCRSFVTTPPRILVRLGFPCVHAPCDSTPSFDLIRSFEVKLSLIVAVVVCCGVTHNPSRSVRWDQDWHQLRLEPVPQHERNPRPCRNLTIGFRHHP